MKLYLEDGRLLKFKRKNADVAGRWLDAIYHVVDRICAAKLAGLKFSNDNFELIPPPEVQVFNDSGEPIQYFNLDPSLALLNEIDEILDEEFAQADIDHDSGIGK